MRRDGADREFNPAWVLSPDLVADALARLRQLCDAPAVADQRSPIVAELADVEAQLERLTDTIALAGNVASVVQRLRRLEHRRQALAETLEACPASPPPLPRIDWRLVERQAHQLLGQWRELLLEDVGDARRVLRELLEGLIQFTPVLDEARRGFRFAGAITIGGMLEGTAVSQAWRPRAESNCRPSA